MAAESDLEKKIGDYAKKRGCLYYKFSSPARRGVPDRIVIAPNGKILFLEIKAPGKKPTALQARELKRLFDQGQTAEWTDNLPKAAMLICNLCDAI